MLGDLSNVEIPGTSGRIDKVKQIGDKPNMPSVAVLGAI